MPDEGYSNEEIVKISKISRPTKTLAKEASALEQDRNKIKATVRWHFTKTKSERSFVDIILR
jgi:hypothetical protein